MKEIRNIGIFAHVDAGKTTLTEHILYQTGCIRNIGRVDHGLAHTDQLSVEKERGISVKSASAKVIYRDTEINIIDTPGHVDFSAEVERAMMVLDGAILVISCIEGVQSQTEIIWKALRTLNIPTLIFINKIDRLGANIKKVMVEVRKLVGNQVIILNDVQNEGCKDVIVDVNMTRLMENVCLYDESLFNQYVEKNHLSKASIKKVIRQKTHRFECLPVLFGAALNGIGVNHVLDAIVDYLPRPDIKKEFIGLVYKINHPLIGGKMAHVRLYGGCVNVRDDIYNHTKKRSEKVTQIFKLEGTDLIPTDHLKGGDIGILCGIHSSQVGDVLGVRARQKIHLEIAKPTLTVKVYPKYQRDLEKLVTYFKILEEEDPCLSIIWQEEIKELQVQLMGVIQMEILTKMIQERFDLEVIFEKPTVIYKETPTKVGKGSIALSTPFFGALAMEVEPLQRNEGVLFESIYSTDYIFPRFQNEVKEVYQQVLKEGVYGWEVTDLKVLITGGRSVKLATSPGDFKKLTPMPLMDALKDCKVTLLEPINTFECSFQVKDAGLILSDLYQMNACIVEQYIKDDIYYVSGTIPLRTSIDYNPRGKVEFHTKFKTYEPCSLEKGKIRKRKTVDPSDHKRYLLSVLPKNMRDNSNISTS